MQNRTSLERKISMFKEYIKRWEEIATILGKKYEREYITKDEKSSFYENIDWCSINYSAIKEAETEIGNKPRYYWGCVGLK
jgi:hypothetical protein